MDMVQEGFDNTSLAMMPASATNNETTVAIADYDYLYSETQNKILGYLSPIIAPFSFIGSAIIIYVILFGGFQCHRRQDDQQEAPSGSSDSNGQGHGHNHHHRRTSSIRSFRAGRAASSKNVVTRSNNNTIDNSTPTPDGENDCDNSKSSCYSSWCYYSCSCCCSFRSRVNNICNNSNASNNNKTKLDPFRRIMLGISFMDLFQSIGVTVFGGPWSIPKEDYGEFVVGASAPNYTLCNISGFFFSCLFGSMWYTLFLGIYFLLIIKHNWTQATFAKYIEPIAHAISFFTSIVLSLIAVVNDWMNPMIILPGMCYLHDNPPSCSNDPDIPCTRGESYHTTLYGLLLGQIPSLWSILIAMTGIITCFVLIVLHVWTIEQKLRSYQFTGTAAATATTYIDTTNLSAGSSGDNNSDESGEEEIEGEVNPNQDSQTRNSTTTATSQTAGHRHSLTSIALSSTSSSSPSSGLQQTKQTSIQALCYICAFFAVWLPVIVLMLLGSNSPTPTVSNRKLYFAVAFLTKFFMPLQGFFNAIIFLRNRV